MQTTILFVTFLHIGSCIGNEQTDEPYPNELVLAAENFARQQDIPPTMILLLSAGSVLSYNGAKTECNMLSVATLLDLITVRTQQTDFPTVLGVNLPVVLISRYDNSLPQDVLRYLRHKFLLHIITSAVGIGFMPSVPTLSWNRESNIVFHCVRSFDHLIFWDSKPTKQSCQTSTPVCNLHGVKQSVSEMSAAILLEVTLKLQCNSTKILAYYLANFAYLVTTMKTVNVDTHMRTYFLTYEFTYLECYTAYRIRPTAVTALLLPFNADVWFGTLFCSLLTATGVSYMVRKRLSITFAEILLSFIAASPLDIKLRQYSGLIAGFAIITLSFFINRIYSNCIMSVFLNPFAFVELHEFTSDCKFEPSCRDYPEFTNFELDSGNAVCSLTESMKSQYGKPLHRYLKSMKKLEVGSDSPFWMLQRDPFRSFYDYFKDPSKGEYTLVFTKRSKTLDKLLQHGMIPLARFEYMRPRQKLKPVAAVANFAIEQTIEHLKKTTRKENIYSGTLEILFEWQSFLKLLPLFCLCMIPTVVCFATEFLSSHCVWFLRHPNDASTGTK